MLLSPRMTLLLAAVLSVGCGTDNAGTTSATPADAGAHDAANAGDTALPDGGDVTSPSYMAVVLSERFVGADCCGEQDHVLYAVRANPTGGIALLFREPAPTLLEDNFHIRYVTRDGDVARASDTFRGGPGLGDIDFDFHPSGELTACSYERDLVMGEAEYVSLHVRRFDADGHLVRSNKIVDAPVGILSTRCHVQTDGEDALIFSYWNEGGTQIPRTDRWSSAGTLTYLHGQAIACLPYPHGRGPMWARSSKNTLWSADGCEIDPKSGKVITAEQPVGSLLALAVGFDGSIRRVASQNGDVLVGELPSNGPPQLLLSDNPFADPFAAVVRSTFLLTDQGWTMPEYSIEGFAFHHAAGIGQAADRVLFPGPFVIEASLIGGDRELYAVGRIGATSTIGRILLTHPGDQTNHFLVARFQDWSSILAARDGR